MRVARRHEPSNDQHPDEREPGANQHRQTQRIRECRLRSGNQSERILLRQRRRQLNCRPD